MAAPLCIFRLLPSGSLGPAWTLWSFVIFPPFRTHTLLPGTPCSLSFGQSAHLPSHAVCPDSSQPFPQVPLLVPALVSLSSYSTKVPAQLSRSGRCALADNGAAAPERLLAAPQSQITGTPALLALRLRQDFF